MNDPAKRAGQSTRDMAEKRYKSRVWFVVLALGALVLMLVLIAKLEAAGIGGAIILGLIIAIRLTMDYVEAKAKRMKREERRAIRGAKGEERIGTDLDDLGEDYLVIHDVTSPYGNIDHIVISQQNGVFLIETKAHGGRVSAVNGRLLVNGHEPEKDFIAQALRNTYWLRDRIRDATDVEIWITPIVVFSNAFVERATPIKGVTVTNRKFIRDILQRPNSRVYNPSIWENREKIEEALH
jgi:hypothetical protein